MTTWDDSMDGTRQAAVDAARAAGAIRDTAVTVATAAAVAAVEEGIGDAVSTQLTDTGSAAYAALVSAAGTITDPQVAAAVGGSGPTRAALDAAYVVGGAHGVDVARLRQSGDTDDTEAIRRAVLAVQSSLTAGIPGGTLYFTPDREYVISDSIDLYKFSGTLLGTGVGNAPNLAYSQGKTSVIRWAGPNDRPMFLLRDYRQVTFRNLRIEGNTTTPPTYAIESRWDPAYMQGANSGLRVEGCYIGKYSWSTQGTDKGVVQSFVGFTGSNGNNDQWHIADCRFRGATGAGIYIPNTQSIWSSITDTQISECAIGVDTSSSISAFNTRMNACDIDWRINSTAQVTAVGYCSENSKTLVQCTSTGRFIQYGGVITLQTSLQDGVGGYLPFMKHDDCVRNAGIILDGVIIQYQIPAANVKIRARTVTSGSTEPGRISLNECWTQMGPANFDIATTSGCRLRFSMRSNKYEIDGYEIRDGQTLPTTGLPSRRGGIGSPEGTVIADPGSIYQRSDVGGAGLSLYVKESGVGTNTGWIAK